MYLFILCYEVLLVFVKTNHKARGVNIFHYTYLYKAYEDDASFFLKTKSSMSQFTETVSTFFKYFCIKSSCEKCRIAKILNFKVLRWPSVV